MLCLQDNGPMVKAIDPAHVANGRWARLHGTRSFLCRTKPLGTVMHSIRRDILNLRLVQCGLRIVLTRLVVAVTTIGRCDNEQLSGTSECGTRTYSAGI